MIDSKAFFQADADGDGLIDYPEFAGFMYTVLEESISVSSDEVEQRLKRVLDQIPVPGADEQKAPEPEGIPILMCFDPLPICKFKEFLHPHQKGKVTDGWERKTALVMEDNIIKTLRGGWG